MLLAQAIMIVPHFDKQHIFHLNIYDSSSNYNFIVSYFLLMEPAKANSNYSTQIRGRNFYGSIEINQNKLALDLTQFGKGGFFTLEVTNLHLQKDFKRFLIFKKMDDLFEELVQNQKLQIGDQNNLIIPINVKYKNKTFELKLELPLAQRKFNSQAQKIQILLQKLQKSNKQKLAMNQLIQSIPQLVKFQGDQKNSKFTSFQVSQNKKTIKSLATNSQHAVFNHFCPLKNKGIFSFKSKILKTANKFIFLGICSKDIRQITNQNLYLNPLFMGFYLANGYLYGNYKYFAAATGFTIVQEQSIFRVEVDMTKNIISWFHNEAKLYSTEITKDLLGTDICLMLTLYSNGDSVQFLDQ